MDADGLKTWAPVLEKMTSITTLDLVSYSCSAGLAPCTLTVPAPSDNTAHSPLLTTGAQTLHHTTKKILTIPPVVEVG
eukprot:2611004-Rhodomonas_salina.2